MGNAIARLSPHSQFFILRSLVPNRSNLSATPAVLQLTKDR